MFILLTLTHCSRIFFPFSHYCVTTVWVVFIFLWLYFTVKGIKERASSRKVSSSAVTPRFIASCTLLTSQKIYSAYSSLPFLSYFHLRIKAAVFVHHATLCEIFRWQVLLVIVKLGKRGLQSCICHPSLTFNSLSSVTIGPQCRDIPRFLYKSQTVQWTILRSLVWINLLPTNGFCYSKR